MNTTTETASEYRAYIASLSDYNNGRLTGFWLDLEFLTASEIEAAISDWLEELGPDECGMVREEYAVHDWEGVPRSFGEYPEWEAVAAYVEAIEEHGDAMRAWLEMEPNYNTPEGFSDAYCGEFKDLEDYAYEFLSDTSDIENMLGSLAGYFDYAAYGRDLQLNGDVRTVDADNGNIYVFNNH